MSCSRSGYRARHRHYCTKNHAHNDEREQRPNNFVSNVKSYSHSTAGGAAMTMALAMGGAAMTMGRGIGVETASGSVGGRVTGGGVTHGGACRIGALGERGCWQRD